MTYHGEVKRSRPHVGIKPTEESRAKVRAWSIMGLGVREICARLGELFKLGKPMSRMTLYYHFRADLVAHQRGPLPSTTSVKNNIARNISDEMQKMIVDMAKHGTKR